MTNIPTDLLRTLVAVADMHSFTKAAVSLGVTQPAVSAQIKRLQTLLGSDLLDRSIPGVSLTPQGEKVITYARRMLSINDRILDIADENPASEQIIRVGAQGDFVASVVSAVVAQFREQWPGVRFVVQIGTHEPLIRDLRQGDLDVLAGLSADDPIDARHRWPEEMCWVRGPNTRIDVNRPIPLISYGEKGLHRFVATSALKEAGLEHEDIFMCPSLLSLSGAVAAGLGVMALARRRVAAFGLIPWDDGPLPKLHDAYCGIYLREGQHSPPLHEFTDTITEILRPGGNASFDLNNVFASSYKVLKAGSSAA